MLENHATHLLTRPQSCVHTLQRWEDHFWCTSRGSLCINCVYHIRGLMYLRCDDDALDDVPVLALDVHLVTSSSPGSTGVGADGGLLLC